MKVSHPWTRLAPVALTWLCICAPAQAALIQAAPGPDGMLGDQICSLREAVNASNNETNGGGDCDTGSGTDTIVLSPGTYDLTGPAGDDANASGDLDILNDVVINGPGGTTIDAHQTDRIFDIYGGINATISGITITGGRAPNGTNGTTSVGQNGEAGGAIRAGGDLTLDGVTLTANRAGDGGTGGTSGTTGLNGGGGGRGGAIDADGSLTVRNSTVSDNQGGKGGTGGASGPGTSDTAGNGGQGGSGGAIQAAGVTTIESSTISGNRSGMGGTGGTSATGTPGGGGPGGFGGGINSGAALTISRSTISSNTSGTGGTAGPATNNGAAVGGFAAAGGGIAAATATGEINISDSVIADNRTGDAGSGPAYTPFAPRGADGGGLWISFGKATVERTTISGNRTGDGAPGNEAGSGGYGAGIATLAVSSLALLDSTVSGNSTGNGGASATHPGGGGNGGGIFVAISSSQSLTITNVTVTGNSTGNGGNATSPTESVGGRGGIGGGLYINAKATLNHITVAANQTGAGGTGEVSGPRGPGGGIDFAASTETLGNSIVASNSPANCNVAAAATLTDGGHNVSFGDTTCPGVNGDPLLAPLLSAGGPTQTMGLGEGSSAIDLVPADANCAAADQRGVPRPQRAACDAGAYEAVALPPADQQPPGGGPTPPAKDTTPPVVKLLLTKQKLLKALKKGYVCFFRTNEVGTASATFGKFAKGKLKITKTGKQKLVLKFTKKARKALAKKKRVRLKLVLSVKDAAGNTTRKTAKVTLKR